MTRYGLYAALFCSPEEVSVQTTWEKLALGFLLTHQARMQAWPLEGYEEYAGKQESRALPKKLYTPSK